MTNKSKIMMSYSYRDLMLLVVFVAAGCSAMKESVKARKMLEKCSFDLSEIQLEVQDFESAISFDNEDKKVDVNNLKGNLLSLAGDIKSGNFSMDLSQLRFNAVIQITNPNGVDVELDSIKLRTFLDDRYLVDVEHLEHTVVPANSTYATNVGVIFPTAFPVKEIFTAEHMVFKGKVWLNLMITKKKRFNLPVPISLKREIPRDEINAAIEEEKQEKIDLMLDYIKSDGANKLKKKIKSKF